MYRVPASVTIAQAILESGWGGSELATRANNYFGIKCAAVASPHQIGCIDKATWEHLNGNDVTVTASFRRYASMRDSFLDHGLFLTKPRYAAAFKAATPDEFAHEIWRAGYATDPQYPAKLVRLMDQYELRQYDDPKQQEAPMPKVFLSPSDQDNNPVHGGGHEQQYAQIRCRVAADVLRNSGIDVKVSEAGIGDDSGGYAASVREGEAWGPDVYVADHTNATGTANRASGVQAYCWLADPSSKRLGECINARMDPIVPGGASIQDGSGLYEVSGPSATAVLMESGYHDNPVDAAVIRTKTTEMGEALAYGILDYFGIQTTTTTPSQEDDMSDPQVIELLTQISRQTLGSADALTRGQSGIKWDGDAYRHLAIISDALTPGYPANPDAGIEERPPGAIYTLLTSIESKLDAQATTEPERAESEPETPAETAPVTGANAIRSACAAIRSEQAAHAAYIESRLSIIESNL